VKADELGFSAAEEVVAIGAPIFEGRAGTVILSGVPQPEFQAFLERAST
jgi:hypothetical protein